MRALLVLCAIILSTALSRGEGDERFDQERLAAFREKLEEILGDTGTPGLGAVIAIPERVIWAGGIGVADKKSKQPVTDGTVFRIGSISKSFVALSAMMLVEEARLDLRTPLRELAPEIEFENPWEETAPVRMVHLMEHTTGWEDLTLREHAHNVVPPISLRAGLSFDPRSRTSRWPPGRSTSYCNSGPPVAAFVIQKLVGQDFEEFVRARIFTPLNMPLASFRADGAVAERLATGYHRGKKVRYRNLLQRPAGAINTTPREMANYLRFYLNEGELNGVRLVKPESIDRMMEARTPRAVQAGAEQWYGLCLARYSGGGQIWYGHTGGLEGYLADMAWCPRLEVGYVIMINSDTGGGFPKLRSAFREFLTENESTEELPPVANLASGLLDSYQGYYLPLTRRAERNRFQEPFTGVVRVKADSEGLDLSSREKGDWKLVPVGERLFRKPEDHLASAVFYAGDEEGEASFSIGAEYRRVSPLFVWSHWIVAGGAVLLMVTTLLFALLWVPRLLFGRKLSQEPFLSVRILPLLSTLFCVASAVLVTTAATDAISRLGKPTPWSVGFMVCTLLFAFTAIAGLCVSLSSKRTPINPVVRWHSLLVSASQVILALYLACWGVIGLRSWV